VVKTMMPVHDASGIVNAWLSHEKFSASQDFPIPTLDAPGTVKISEAENANAPSHDGGTRVPYSSLFRPGPALPFSYHRLKQLPSHVELICSGPQASSSAYNQRRVDESVGLHRQLRENARSICKLSRGAQTV
jgi:hypothetical protein